MPTAEATQTLDVVELRVDAGRWPAGTVATVLEVFGTGVIVEITDTRGHTLDMLSLPHVAIRVRETPDQQRLPLAG